MSRRLAGNGNPPDQAHHDFGPFEGRVWLNAAHQGPLPRVAVDEARRAIDLKIAPHRIPDEAFFDVPHNLKHALADLLDASAEDIVLGNSASYGLHVLANGIGLRPGDEVILVDGDFPSTLLPWLRLAEQGVRARVVRPAGVSLQPDELKSYLTPATRVVCMDWVNSFSGYAVDVDEMAGICRAAGVLFILNGAQAVGVRPLSVSRLPVDAVTSCGYKWLCGPYGTGFLWARRELLESLAVHQSYWLVMQSGQPLDDMRQYEQARDSGARAHDVFCPASFNNVMPWTAAVTYLHSLGIEQIAAYVQQLVSRLVDGIDPASFTVKSPTAGAARSTLVVVSHRDPAHNSALHAALRQAGVDAALRAGCLRFSPHLYNTAADIDRALNVLDAKKAHK